MTAAILPPVVGVFGGTFDPVHFGHLAVAERVRSVLRLPEMLFLPTANPPHKPAAVLAPIADRIAMIELALRDLPGFGWSAIESEPGRICYTIDTLRALRDGTPRRRPIFCVGGDSLAQLQIWRDWRAMIEEFDLAAVDRSSGSREWSSSAAPEVASRLVEIGESDDPTRLDPGHGGRIFLVAMTPVPISSSDVRARVAAGHSIEGLVPPAVARYIHGADLYRSGDRR